MKKVSLLLFVCLYSFCSHAQTEWTKVIIPGLDNPKLFKIVEHTSGLYVSGKDGLYRSNDGGQTWIKINVPVSDDFTSIAFIQNRMLLTSQPKVFYSDDWGASWAESATQFYQIDGWRGIHVHQGKLFLAADNKLHISHDAGIHWTTNGISFGAIFTPYFYHAEGFTFGFASKGDTLFMANDYAGVLFTTDFGASWTRPANNFPGYIGVSNFGLRVHGNTLYLLGDSVSGGSYLISTDWGENWQLARPYDSNMDIEFYGASIIDAHSNGISISNDGGQTWQDKNEGFPDFGSYIGSQPCDVHIINNKVLCTLYPNMQAEANGLYIRDLNSLLSLPSITSIAPTSGPIGTLVTISGNYLSQATKVTVGGVEALIINKSEATLTAMIMPGTTDGQISVTTSSGTAAGQLFDVVDPVLPLKQQGPKIVPDDAIGAAEVGFFTAISADGNTAIVGGPNDDNYKGAAWIYARSNGSWTKQAKLVNPESGSCLGGHCNFGLCVGISADGNTAIVGASSNDNGIGAAYTFVRNGNNWSQQAKLVGTGYVGSIIHEGEAVALSADGNTAIITGVTDNSGKGAAWVFRRSGTTWAQDGNKLTTNTYSWAFGYHSVALSSDGKTALILDPLFGHIFTFSNNSWSEQSVLTDNTNMDPWDCALSANGDVAIISNSNGNDFNLNGGVVFRRENGIWQKEETLKINQPDMFASGVAVSAEGNIATVGWLASNWLGGNNYVYTDTTCVYQKDGSSSWVLKGKLKGTTGINAAAVWCKISNDGQTAIVGGLNDNNEKGAFWMYNGTPSSTSLYTISKHGTKNSEVLVPVKVNKFNNILSSQFSVKWDPTVATFVDVETFGLSGLNNNSFGTTSVNSGQLTLSWSEPNLNAQTLPDSTTLFNIRLKLTGNYGAQTPVSISAQPLAIEVVNNSFSIVDVTTAAGTIAIDAAMAISGKILYPNSQPVQSVTVNLNGGTPQSFLTDQSGDYSFIAPAGINYSLTPVKVNDPNPLNGIDVQDVASVRRHILGVEALGSPYQIIAADINKSNNVSTLDIDYIQALILGVKNNFPDNNQWTFAPGDYLFADSSNPFPYLTSATLSQIDGHGIQDFIAMKLGDVNNSRDNSQQNRQAANELVFVIDAGKTTADILEVPIQVRNFEGISAYQFTITWDAEKLDFVNVVNENTEGRFGKNRINDGMLTTLWDEGSGKSKDLGFEAILFKIQFGKKTGEASGTDLNITSTPTGIAVYDKNLKAVAYQIDRKEGEEPTEFELYQNFPNGFEKTTQIDFTIPQNGNVAIEIIDVTGRKVWGSALDFEAGKNFFEWDGKDSLGAELKAGLYIYKVQYGSTVKSKKLVKIK